jgi:hypothetical protein
MALAGAGSTWSHGGVTGACPGLESHGGTIPGLAVVGPGAAVSHGGTIPAFGVVGAMLIV